MGFEFTSKSLGKNGFRLSADRNTGVWNSPSNLRPPFTLPVRPVMAYIEEHATITEEIRHMMRLMAINR